MTVVLAMRDRIAAAAQVELMTRRMAATADITYAIADRALEGTQYEALTGYVAAIETGADPAGARDQLASDGVNQQILDMTP